MHEDFVEEEFFELLEGIIIILGGIIIIFIIIIIIFALLGYYFLPLLYFFGWTEYAVRVFLFLGSIYEDILVT